MQPERKKIEKLAPHEIPSPDELQRGNKRGKQEDTEDEEEDTENLWCEPYMMKCNSTVMMVTHLSGKRHASYMGKVKKGLLQHLFTK